MDFSRVLSPRLVSFRKVVYIYICYIGQPRKFPHPDNPRRRPPPACPGVVIQGSPLFTAPLPILTLFRVHSRRRPWQERSEVQGVSLPEIWIVAVECGWWREAVHRARRRGEREGAVRRMGVGEIGWDLGTRVPETVAGRAAARWRPRRWVSGPSEPAEAPAGQPGGLTTRVAQPRNHRSFVSYTCPSGRIEAYLSRFQ